MRHTATPSPQMPRPPAPTIPAVVTPPPLQVAVDTNKIAERTGETFHDLPKADSSDSDLTGDDADAAALVGLQPSLAANRAEPDDDLGWRVLKAAPAWLFSMVVHLVALVLFGLLFLATDRGRDLQLEGGGPG